MPTFPHLYRSPSRAAQRYIPGLLIIAALALASLQVSAQTWPTRPITIVVPYPAGGGVDTVARILASDLSKRLPQQVVIENKPGAGTIIGTNAIAAAQPDGHTIGIITDSHAINPGFGRTLPYDTARDFSVLSGLIKVPLVLIVNSRKNGARTLPELISAAKQQPGELTFASLGPGSPHQLAFEWLRALAGVDVRIVPYRGVAPALQDVVGGQVDMMLVGVGVADGFIAEGRVRPVAVTGAARLDRFPEAGTVAEQGYPGYEIVTWYGAVAPAKVPSPILDRLREEIRRSLDTPDVRGKLSATGAEIYTGTTDDFTELLRVETEKYRRVIQLTGSKLE